ncbi:MAG: quinolinate synthase NadA [Clostridiales bacterium]|nr:quinolinate synthase NadA [Clostridiales bacterium]
MFKEIQKIKKEMGDKLYILAHHYEPDEIVACADAVGDSLKLARLAAENKRAEYIVFCGVHFMAETADILTEKGQRVLLPERSAGCPMADMADRKSAEKCMKLLEEKFGKGRILPITYVNSKAEVKAFCGKYGGTVVTSGNAPKILKWGLNSGKIVLFLPDQNLGRNTAVDLGVSLDEMALYNQFKDELYLNCPSDKVKIVLWGGYCHVHHFISDETFFEAKKANEGYKVLLHPECRYDIVKEADGKGSTEFIINVVKGAPDGSKFLVGTEKNLVERIARDNPSKEIKLLDSNSICRNMNKINTENLYETLCEIKEGNFKRQISVDDETAALAVLALDKMLELS